MYISVNRDTGRFLHKHQDFRVVCNLDFITTHLRPEHHHKVAWIEVTPITHYKFLDDWNEVEKQKLYRNTTGEERSPYLGTQLIGVLVELADRFPVSAVNPFEAEVQATFIETKHQNGLGPRYLYNPGATTPVVRPDLWDGELYTRLLITPEDAAVAARTRAPRAPVPVPLPITAAAGAPRSAPRIAARKGGVRETIWRVADDTWNAAGQPNDKTAVLALRRTMMEILDRDYGVKRSSSSNELGNWQKERCK